MAWHVPHFVECAASDDAGGLWGTPRFSIGRHLGLLTMAAAQQAPLAAVVMLGAWSLAEVCLSCTASHGAWVIQGPCRSAVQQIEGQVAVCRATHATCVMQLMQQVSCAHQDVGMGGGGARAAVSKGVPLHMRYAAVQVVRYPWYALTTLNACPAVLTWLR